MSEVTTAYKIRLFFQTDRSRGTLSFLEQVGRKADGAAKQTQGLASQLKGIAALTGGAIGLASAKRAFIDFNAELEGMKIGMASLLQMNIGGYFDEASVRATKLVGDFQQIAKASVGTTKDFTQFGSAIMASVLQANMGLGDTAARINQLKTITKGGVIAATVMGEHPELVSRDIEQWLNGRLSTVDRFSKKLLAPMGMTHQQLNAKKPEERLRLLEKALTQPAILEATKAYEQSWLGVSSTMEDTLQMMAGRIGLPLFKAITEEVKKWNEWIERNPEKVEAFAKQVSDLLIGAFGVAKDVFGFIVDHRDLLLILAKAALMSKGVGIIGNIVGGPFRAIAGLSERFAGLGNAAGVAGGKTLTMAEKMTSASNRIAGAVGVMGAVYVGAQTIADMILASQDRRIAEKMDVHRTAMTLGVGGKNADAIDVGAQRRLRTGAAKDMGTARAMAAQRALAEAREAGLITAQGTVNIRGAQKIRGSTMGGYRPGFDPTNPMQNQMNLAGVGTQFMTFEQAYEAMKRGYRTDAFGNKTSIQGFGADKNPFKAFAQDTEFDEWFNKTFAKEMEFVDRLEQALAEDRKVKAADFDAFLQRMNLTMSDIFNPGKFISAVMADASNKATQNGKLKQPTPRKADVNVNIRKVEVVADDPDRVVLGIMSAAEDAVRNPSVALTSTRDR